MNNLQYADNCVPTLYLKGCSSVRQGLTGENLLKPYYISPKNLIIADLAAESLEIKNEEGLITRSLWGKCINGLSQELVDPNNKLKQLFDEKKIERIKTNAPIDQAEIIFLDDTFHGNQEQTHIRGEIANALRGEENIFLGEGFSSDKLNLTASEIYHAFAANLEINLSKDTYAGWDDKLVYKQSQDKLRLGLQTVKLLDPKQSATDFDLSKLALMLATLNDFQEVTGKEAYARTENEWKTIKKYKELFPKVKILVFAGAAHNNEQWLEDQLKESQYKYCIITPKKCQDTTEDSGFDAIGNAMKYYNVDKYGIWGNLKH
jgi:hypothetical protein